MTNAPSDTKSGDDGGDSTTAASSKQKAKNPLHTSADCDCDSSPPAPPPTEPSTKTTTTKVPSPAEREAKLKAAARAYALSGTTNEGKNYKRKLPLQSPVAATTANNTNATRTGTRTGTTTQNRQQQNQQHNTNHTAQQQNHARTKFAKQQGASPPNNNSSPNHHTNNTTAQGSNPHKRPRTAITGNGAVRTTTTTTTTSATTSSTSSTLSSTMPTIPATNTSAQRKTGASKPPRPPPGSVVVAGGPLGAISSTTSTSKGAGGKASKHKPASPSANNNNSSVHNSVNPINAMDYDPEYLKLIQSLGELDDFSIWDNLDNVDDEEFRLSDLDDDDDDMDGYDDDDDDDNDNDEEDALMQAAARIATNTSGIPSTPAMHTSTVNSNNNTDSNTHTNSNLQPPIATNSTPVLSSPSLSLPGWDEDHQNGGIFYKDLEEELGSLLEEELEAAVRSLYTSKGSGGSGSGSGTVDETKKKKKDAKKNGKASKQQKQKQQQQLLQASSNQQGTFVATTTATAGKGVLTPVTAATLAADAKRKQLEEKGAPGTPLRETARQGNSATVTYKQSQQLRVLMKKHYQLLAQQAILSVRAAHGIKTGISGLVSSPLPLPSSNSNSNSLPPSSSSSSPLLSTKGNSGAGASSLPKNKGWGGGDFLCGENETDLTEILDLAVGMLQDLDQNRKDAIRTSIQLAMSSSSSSSNGGNANKDTANAAICTSKADANAGNKNGSGNTTTQQHPRARRSLLSQFSEDSNGSTSKNNKNKSKNNNINKDLVSQSVSPSNQGGGSGRLTRAAFRKLQAQPIVGSKRTAFDIPGLLKLDETFATIDDSVNIAPTKGQANSDSISNKKVNILEASTHAHACRDVLKDAGANVEEGLLPGVLDVSENFSQLEEHLGDDFQSPCSLEQEQFLRKNRNLFTSGEDNLVLRGVNLYGEKQWILIGDRYLPDRSVNIISQRYSKLCVMLYKAHGIDIDDMGNLLEPPRHESVDDIDERKVEALGLKLVEPPAILNVHRWSMEEDLTILKGVPIMGHMWAELGARLIPHRDRGHLRKRYQVLERRVKATITRGKKERARNYNRKGTTKARAKTPIRVQKATKAKTTFGASIPKTSSTPSTTSNAKARSSPARKEKKLSSPAKSKTTSSKTSTSKRKLANSKYSGAASNQKTNTKKTTPTNASTGIPPGTSPTMSLETGAALLASFKPKETATSSKALPPSKTPKNVTKPTTAEVPKDHKSRHPKEKGQTPHPDAEQQPHPSMMPPGDPRRPYYPYVYDRYSGRYYIPGYPYHAHPPPTENDKNDPAYGKHHPAVHYQSQNFPTTTDELNKLPISFASPKSSTMVRLQDLDTPNSKSFMEKIPDIMKQDFSALGGDGETSRQAYEKLMEFVGGNDEGLQLSRVQKMMENKDESEAAKAIVAHLAKSPGRGGSEFPSLLDSNSNITGLSILNEISKPPFVSKDESGLSIMARVLGTSDNNPKDAPTSTSIIPGIMPSPLKKSAGPKNSNSTNDIRTPTKLKGDSFFRNSDPETPKLPTMSMFGTPLGLSPGLRTLRASALLKDDPNPNNNSLETPFSPTPSSLMKTDGLATNLTFPYSMAPSMSFRGGFDDKHTDDNINEHAAFDHHFDQDSRVCEDSNQLGDLAVGAALTNNADQLPNGNNSLAIAQEEFDAISGLGALSNSPFKTVKSLEQKDRAKKKKDNPPTSFFRRVVGDSKEKSPQKKLF